jgi:hypothetical protein
MVQDKDGDCTAIASGGGSTIAARCCCCCCAVPQRVIESVSSSTVSGTPCNTRGCQCALR